MAAELHLAKLADGWFLATQGGAKPENWSKQQLQSFLAAHGYSAGETAWIVGKAEQSPELFIRLREAKAK